MSNARRLAFSIVSHFASELERGAVTGDSAESLEVVIQCLEQVYNINKEDAAQVQQLKTDKTLQEIFDSSLTMTTGSSTMAEPTAEERVRAEELKTQGNQLMKEEKYNEAIKCYTDAMKLDSKNAVFLCNRAAAYSKLGEHNKAIDDCKKAVTLDSNYGKAYGRMGLSYQNIQDYQKAKESYKKAVELEPGNTFYQSSLSQVEAKLQESQSRPGGGSAAGMPNLGGMDFSALLGNPAIMNMAQSFMTNPQVQQMVGNLMTGAGGRGAGEGGGIGNLFQATQQFAEQMQESNPELFQELQSQVNEARNQSQNPPDNTNTKPDDKSNPQ